MNNIESKMKQLQPNTGALDRDQLLYSAAFAAGKATASPKFPWRWICSLLLCTQIGLIGWIVRTPTAKVEPAVIQAITEPVIPVETSPHVSPEPTSYIALMQHLGDDAATTNYPEPTLPRAPLTPHSRID